MSRLSSCLNIIFTSYCKSINIVECPEFRALLLLLRSDLKETMVPHRTKLRELIIEAWKRYFQVLKQDLAVRSSTTSVRCPWLIFYQNAAGQISFTIDIWSDKNRRAFLAMTAHWIGNVNETKSLQSKIALIAFHRLQGGHNGKSLANTVLQLLDRAGITLKVSVQLNI